MFIWNLFWRLRICMRDEWKLWLSVLHSKFKCTLPLRQHIPFLLFRVITSFCCGRHYLVGYINYRRFRLLLWVMSELHLQHVITHFSFLAHININVLLSFQILSAGLIFTQDTWKTGWNMLHNLLNVLLLWRSHNDFLLAS